MKAFADRDAQDVWIAEQIHQNLTVDELEHDDFLIVLPDSYRAKTRGPLLMRQLAARGIDSHLVGVNTSVDEVFQPSSIAIAHIYRAKGNEAPMVYAVDAQLAAATFNAVTARNKLFTAITRSRAWVRVTGFGDQMTALAKEVRSVTDHQYRLEFTIPTQPELARLRHLNRERSESDVEAVKRGTEGLNAFLEAVERGEMDFFDLPPAMRTKLVTRLRAEDADDLD